MADTWKNLKYDNVFPIGVIKSLDKALSSVSKLVNLLTKSLGLLQMFINSFNSFSTILRAFVSYCQNQIGQFSRDIAGAGVYVNVLVPPSFLKGLENNQLFSGLSSGGFDGFMQRLRVSLHNTADKNAPRFSDEASVGGMIVLLDSETLYDFYRGIDFLKSMFDFMDIFPINTAPPPPRNVRGAANYYELNNKIEILDESGNKIDTGVSLKEKKLGIRLDWDSPAFHGFTSYKISRSLKSGGELVSRREVPKKLIGPKGREEEGLLTAAKMFMFDGFSWPAVLTNEYNDPNFNKGNPVVVRANPVNGNGAFIDFDVDPKEVRQYYYVVQSGFPVPLLSLWGPRSTEAGVSTNPKACINKNQYAAVVHENGVELLSAGAGSLGQWSSIKAQAILPFLKPILDLVNSLLSSLAGAVKTNSKAFSDYLAGIKQKFEKYRHYLEVITTMISALENFFSGAPKIAFLQIPAQKGGVNHLIDRITLAQQPLGGFSGQSGFSLGIVFIYGESLSGDAIGSETPNYQEQILALSKAFSIIQKCLS